MQEFLKRRGITGISVKHVSKELVHGKTIYGMVPLYIACEADKVVVPIIYTPESLRGSDLNANQLESLCHGFETYHVTKTDSLE
jgi:hypothetical protein